MSYESGMLKTSRLILASGCFVAALLAAASYAAPFAYIANSGSNNVSVFLGNGAGSFASATNYSVGTSPFAAVLGDLDGDGKLDVVTVNSGSANVSVLLGSGTGTLGLNLVIILGTMASLGARCESRTEAPSRSTIFEPDLLDRAIRAIIARHGCAHHPDPRGCVRQAARAPLGADAGR